ncbi:hypothetical protein AB3X93_14705, partial [Paraburkholderia sp. BR14262]|uniref:hypothetical protein n=1 Tax=Paraburkholderia sp. BR14262 TaxID=3236999 RepID=UPI0034CF2E7C
ATPRYFHIPKPLTEQLPTRNFGTITMTSPSPAVIENIMGSLGKPDADEGASYRELVAACATGEHGERFTAALLAELPGQCLMDWIKLRTAALRICGVSEESVGNI